MGQHHFTTDAREILQHCLDSGFSLRQIGKILGFSAAALCKEIKRNSVNGEYVSDFAQAKLVGIPSRQVVILTKSHAVLALTELKPV